MAKFNYQESEHYGSAKSSYFSLKDENTCYNTRSDAFVTAGKQQKTIYRI